MSAIITAWKRYQQRHSNNNVAYNHHTTNRRDESEALDRLISEINKSKYSQTTMNDIQFVEIQVKKEINHLKKDKDQYDNQLAKLNEVLQAILHHKENHKTYKISSEPKETDDIIDRHRTRLIK